MRILIADDSEILLSRLTERLKEIEQIEIIGEAKDSNEAIKATEVLNPDIVVLDIRMAGGNGISALEAIKRTKKRRPIVIVFTNYPYLQYRKKCLDAGADFFFYKATELDKLVELIKGLLLHHKKN